MKDFFIFIHVFDQGSNATLQNKSEVRGWKFHQKYER